MVKTFEPLPAKLFPGLWIFIFMLLPAAGIHAQDKKINWGISAPLALKFQLLPSGGSRYGVWGHFALCIVNTIEGSDRQALSFMSKSGFSIDFTHYPTPAEGTLLMERASFLLNPEIVFPTGRDRLKITAGFGVEWNGYFLAQTASGSRSNLEDELNKNRRKIFPFVTAGVLYNLKYDFCLQVFARQMMAGYFTREALIFFQQQGGEPALILNDKPTFAGFGILYFFKRDDGHSK